MGVFMQMDQSPTTPRHPILSYRTGFQMMKELISRGEKPQLASNEPNIRKNQTKKPNEHLLKWWGAGLLMVEPSTVKKIFVKIGFIFSKGVQFQHERYLKPPPGHPPGKDKRNFFHHERHPPLPQIMVKPMGTEKVQNWLVVSTHLKIVVKLDHFPNFRGENKNYLSCHHLEKYQHISKWSAFHAFLYQKPMFSMFFSASFEPPPGPQKPLCKQGYNSAEKGI